jgi:hypothetical protein
MISTGIRATALGRERGKWRSIQSSKAYTAALIMVWRETEGGFDVEMDIVGP